jgi:hypothetical protein
VPGSFYGGLRPAHAVARHKISYQRIQAQWPDMLRITGSLHRYRRSGPAGLVLACQFPDAATVAVVEVSRKTRYVEIGITGHTRMTWSMR